MNAGLVTSFVDALEVTCCTFAPGTEPQRLGQTLMLYGSPKGYEYYVAGQNLVTRGLAGISAALGDAYLSDLKKVLTGFEKGLKQYSERLAKIEAGEGAYAFGTRAGDTAEALKNAIGVVEAMGKNTAQFLQAFDPESSDCERMKSLSKFVLKPFIGAMWNVSGFSRYFADEVGKALTSTD